MPARQRPAWPGCGIAQCGGRGATASTRSEPFLVPRSVADRVAVNSSRGARLSSERARDNAGRTPAPPLRGSSGIRLPDRLSRKPLSDGRHMAVRTHAGRGVEETQDLRRPSTPEKFSVMSRQDERPRAMFDQKAKSSGGPRRGDGSDFLQVRSFGRRACRRQQGAFVKDARAFADRADSSGRQGSAPDSIT